MRSLSRKIEVALSEGQNRLILNVHKRIESAGYLVAKERSKKMPVPHNSHQSVPV